jgi:hypothetical protein
MDGLQQRLAALEQQTEHLRHLTQALNAHTRTVERRLRVWRGIACGLGVVAVVRVPLPLVTAQGGAPEPNGLRQRVENLESKLAHISSGPDEVTITGANLRIVNGLGSTDTANGLGNLIVGYDESRQAFDSCAGSTDAFCTDTRTGSHDVVVGRFNNFSSFGGLVVGELSEISGRFSSVSGGGVNTASGDYSSVSGGNNNTAVGNSATVSGGFQGSAVGDSSSVSGGFVNGAGGFASSVSGGRNNGASGGFSSVSGGLRNAAIGDGSSISAGEENAAGGFCASVSGGRIHRAPGNHASVSGGLSNVASGDDSSVSGGGQNVASGPGSSVSGGGPLSVTAPFTWAAGSLVSR